MPKTSTERARECRARQKLKQQQKKQHKDIKMAKNSTERVREYRARQKQTQQEKQCEVQSNSMEVEKPLNINNPLNSSSSSNHLSNIQDLSNLVNPSISEQTDVKILSLKRQTLCDISEEKINKVNDTMNIRSKDIKLIIKEEKQAVEIQDSQDNYYTSTAIKKEYDSEEDSKLPHENPVNFETVFIKEEILENQNVSEDDCVENCKENLTDCSNVDIKNEIDIEEHSLLRVKDEPMSDTETPQDGSTSQKDVFGEEINKTNSILAEKTKELVKNEITCKICDKKFNKKAYLGKHMNIHSRKNTYECETCKKEFIRKGDLIDHVRIHTGERPYECEICKKTFVRNGALIIHMRIHTDDRPYECEICKKKFKLKWYLTEHRRIHSGEKPYECKICLKTFTQSGSLSCHMRIHNKTNKNLT